MRREADALGITRRTQIAAILPAFTAYAFLGEARAAAPARRGPAQRWIARQDEIGRALASGQMKPVDWCFEVERLGREVDVSELMATVNRSQLTAAGAGGLHDPAKRFVRFLDEHGAPRRLSYGAALFAFGPDDVITPHGHRHMVSAHMVVEGRFRVRNYDRIGDASGAMIVRPTRDFQAVPGQVSTMCSQRDNIHWFVPMGGKPAMTFDVIISGLDAGQPDYEIKAVDVLGGRRRRDGAIVAPIMDFEASSRKYTARL
jgi:hypothetical protein